jgi:hypothetical protein
MAVTLEKCANTDMHQSNTPDDFLGEHTDRGERVCDWCAWMWGCDCH